jgi:MFS family permease
VESVVVAGGTRPLESATPDPEPSALARPSFPPGAINANWFSLFNAVSWQITLGSPAILYAKSQGASATVLGVIAAMTPLLVILQLPTAHLLPRYGYRRFMLAGWGSRTVCIFALAVVPLLTFATPSTRLKLVLLSLLVFNLLRGMVAGAWLPWMSALIPQSIRGRFLSREQIFSQFGGLITLLISAAVLHGNPQPVQFSIVFLISALGATTSLWFIRRIPESYAPEELKRSGHRVPWMQMLMYGPFLRLLVFSLLHAIVVGGLGAFTVAFLRDVAKFRDSLIVTLTTLPVIGALLTVPWLGQRLDRIGSKPVLRLCLMTFVLVLLGWSLVAGGMIPRVVGVAAVLYLMMGMASTNFIVANNRLIMQTIPLMGRNHFFALFTVITSLGLGLSPIITGRVLDKIGAYEVAAGGMLWNRYSIYFATICVVAVVAIAFSFRLQEQVGASAAMAPDRTRALGAADPRVAT